MNELERITINPNQCGGRPCIRGMRIRVKDVLDMLAGGATQEEILADFPDLQPEDIRASIAYASRYLDHTVLRLRLNHAFARGRAIAARPGSLVR